MSRKVPQWIDDKRAPTATEVRALDEKDLRAAVWAGALTMCGSDAPSPLIMRITEVILAEWRTRIEGVRKAAAEIN